MTGKDTSKYDFYSEFLLINNSAQFHDASNRANSGQVAHSNVPEVPVLSWPHIQHATSEVGMLEHQPVALQNIAGLAVTHIVTVLERLTVIHQLMGLASKVLPLIDPYPELSPVLFEDHKTLFQFINS